MTGGSKRRTSSRPPSAPPLKQRKGQSNIANNRRETLDKSPGNDEIASSPGNTVRRTQQVDGLRSNRTPIRQQAEDLPQGEVTPEETTAMEDVILRVENRIIKHVNMLYKKIVLEVKASDSVISDLSKTMEGIETKVNHLKVLTVQHAVALARQRSNSRTPTKSKNRNGTSSLDEEVESRFPSISMELQSVLNPDIICSSACHSLCSYMEFFHKSQDDVRMTARTLAVFLYGLKRDKTREEFKSGIGLQHANFRFKIARSAVRKAVQLTDDMFKEQLEQVIADIVRNAASGSDSALLTEPSAGKPRWLSPVILTKSTMDMARKYYQCVKAEHPPLPQTAEKRQALYICRREDCQ